MASRWPKMGPRRRQDDPRWPQDGFRRLQGGAKMAQDGPRWTQDGLQWCQDGVKTVQDGLKMPQDGAKLIQDGLKMGQDGPSFLQAAAETLRKPQTRKPQKSSKNIKDLHINEHQRCFKNGIFTATKAPFQTYYQSKNLSKYFFNVNTLHRHNLQRHALQRQHSPCIECTGSH